MLSDELQLERFGYRQELLRRLSGFSNFAISFSVISILTGGITLYGYGLQTAGPRGIVLGWMLVSVASLAIVLPLAELASAFPTAGALYHWANFLGNKEWGWFTAMFNYLGQFAITAGIDYGLAEFIAELSHHPGRRETLGIYAVLLLTHALINHFGIRWVAICNDLSAWYHLVGTLLLVGIIAAFAPLQPYAFLWTPTHTSPYPYPYAFCLGLLQAQWTITGYDASAHVSEETVGGATSVPSGMITSVVSSALLGLLMLAVITLAIPDLAQAQAADNAFIAVMRSALGQRLGMAVVLLCLVAMWFCGLASLTSNSRMLYAFARDGGVPFHRAFARISPAHRTPVAAIWVSAGLAFALALYGKAYAVIITISTVLILISYFIPIAIAVRAQRAGRFTAGEKGPFQLGRWSQPVGIVACLWIAFIVVIFVLPPNTMTLEATLGLSGMLGLIYLGVRNRFRGAPYQRLSAKG